MKKQILVLGIIIVILLTSCGQTSHPSATSTPTHIPSRTPELALARNAATLYEQDFEKDKLAGIVDVNGNWSLVRSDAGNHIYCNTLSDNWQAFKFGYETWTDYATEMQVKLLDQNPDQGAEVYMRVNHETEGYRAALNYMSATLAYFPPYRPLSNPAISTEANQWYTFRVEAAGSRIRFYIDDQLMADIDDSMRLNGMAGFGVAPHTKVCVDDIHVWLLNQDGSLGLAPTANPVSKISLEVVTDQAVTGDGGNAWGGHQTRIARTADGVFTSYTIAGSGHFDRKWKLARRQEDGTWLVVAEGDAGKDPVNLLASPDGTLHIIGWPNEIGTMWSGKPSGNQLTMTPEAIPGVSQSNWPYSSAGIDKEGDICILSSVGGETPGGTFQWACFILSTGKWVTQTTFLDYRYCYTYLFPDPSGSLALVSTRDVKWSALGYQQPAGEFDYVFNAFGYWHTDNVVKEPLKQLYFVEEKPTNQFPEVYLDAQQDAYLDTIGNIHVIYGVNGASTQGERFSRHAVLSPDGQLLNDGPLPSDIGSYARIFQDAGGKFYFLGSSGLLYPAGSDGLTLGDPIPIDLQGNTVEYSGFGISAPRTGTLPSNVLDVVFPSSSGQMWIYFQLTLPGN